MPADTTAPAEQTSGIPPLALTLMAGRVRYNALFAQARRAGAGPGLDAGRFASHLRESVAPVVGEVAAVAPARVPEVVDALYELSLDLVAKEVLGPGARRPELAALWARALFLLPRAVADAPRIFPAAVANALHHLFACAGARPVSFVETLVSCGDRSLDAASLLEAGKVAAWRAGLAHFRAGALAAAARLDEPLARAALGIADAASAGPSVPGAAAPRAPGVRSVLARLRADPWLDPAAPANARRQLRIVGSFGAFRGFGGPFITPPRAVVAGGRIHVEDAEARFLVCADRFGITLHRAGPDDARADDGAGRRGAARFRVDPDGRVTCGRRSALFPELAGASSGASDGTTLAVALPLSHRVVLIGLAR